MSGAFELQPLGRAGPAGDPVRADPTSGVIKEERKCVVWRQRLPDGTPAVLKLYRHRKARLSERLGLYTGRAEREFRALCHLHDRGVACSEPLFWARGERPDTGRYELLATREVEGAVDLKAWMLEHAGKRELDLTPLFALAAEAHRTGLQHGALLERNVLMRDGRYFLIDLPRCQFFGRSIEGSAAGRFDVRTLANSFLRYLPDAEVEKAVAGYAALNVSPAEFVRGLRTHPVNDRKLNAWKIWFSTQAWLSSRLTRQ